MSDDIDDLLEIDRSAARRMNERASGPYSPSGSHPLADSLPPGVVSERARGGASDSSEDWTRPDTASFLPTALRMMGIGWGIAGIFLALSILDRAKQPGIFSSGDISGGDLLGAGFAFLACLSQGALLFAVGEILSRFLGPSAASLSEYSIAGTRDSYVIDRDVIPPPTASHNSVPPIPPTVAAAPPPPQDNETAAATSLEIARRLFESGKRTEGILVLRDLVARYPSTQAAATARRNLQRFESHLRGNRGPSDPVQ